MLRIEKLTKFYGATCAVNNLSLHVPPGEFFCFLGPNGAGKTTTIKTVCGLLRPTEGSVTVGGHDVVSAPVPAKRLIGYVPDSPFLYPKLTAREFLRFVGGLWEMEPREVAARGEEMLELFDIRAVGDTLTEDYSHGMRQKLVFAAAFLHRPTLAVIDEPWVGLDPKSIRNVKNFLKEQARAGAAVFMSTHTLSIAQELADRIGIIHEGRLIACGTMDEIRAAHGQDGDLESLFLALTDEESDEAGVDPALAPHHRLTDE